MSAITVCAECAVTPLGRRGLLQIVLFAPLAAPCRGRMRVETRSPATDPIRTLNNGLLAVMKAGKSVPFAERYNTLSRVVEERSTCPRYCGVV